MDRRQFNTYALSALVASVAAGNAGAAFGSSGALSPSSKTLNRLTFGATEQSIAEFEAMGKKQWLAEQLSLPALDADMVKRLANARLHIEYEAGYEGFENDGEDRSWPGRNEVIPYQYLDVDGAALLRLTDFDTTFIDWEERVRPSREVQSSVFIRSVHAKAQLREVMTQFWHDHVNVNSQSNEVTAAYFVQYDAVMRANSLGNFRKMLGEVTRSPAMLFYLNNEASQASPANENFARELLELHTLGAPNYVNGQYASWAEVPGADEGMAQGYLDEDVYEVARAFTGWTFGDGRYLAEGRNAPVTGAFYYEDSWHDPYQKRILGAEFPPNSGPMADGEKVLDLLAAHPGTAHYVCEKICRRLLMDNPPKELVSAAAQTFLAHRDAPDQIGKVIETIVMSETFEAVPARKLKRPFEFLISLYRTAGIQLVSPSYDLVYVLGNTGWSQHEFRPPTGHSDLSEDWANTSALKGTVDLALFAIAENFTGVNTDYRALMGEAGKNWGSALIFWFERFKGVDDPKGASVALLDALDISPDMPLPEDDDELDWLVNAAIGLSALTPKFMFR